MNAKAGVFITGTDTGVGKTVVGAGLALVLRSRGIRVGVMKPVATGCQTIGRQLVSQDAVYLFEAAQNEFAPLTNPVRYRNPLAPSVAAVLENREVNLKEIHRAYQALQRYYDFIIIEGIGGLMVPLTRDYFVAHLIRDFRLPMILVTRPSLGTINHTLLTVDAALIRGFEIKGIIFNQTPLANYSMADLTNPKTVHDLTGLPILGSLPAVEGVDVDACQYGRLREIFEERIQVDRILAGSPLGIS